MRRYILLIAPLLALPACDDDYETTGTVRVVANGGLERSWLVANAENLGVGPSLFGPIAGDIASVWYAIGSERSAYLFDGDLVSGISSGGYLALPAYQPGSPLIVEDAGLNWMVVGPDRPSYESMRIYDSGACSLTLDWSNEIIPDLIPAFASTVAAAVDKELASCSKPPSEQFSRLEPATVEPIFRARAGGAAGALGLDDDVFRYTARYNAESVVGCAPLNLDIAFEVGFRQDEQGAIVGFVDEQSVWAEVVDFCIFESQIEDKVVDKLRDKLPDALANAVRNGTLINPTSIGLDPAPSCGDDADCSGVFPGDGHKCVEDVCKLQLNVDRINMRPEGMELVLMETEDDPQRPLIGGSTFEGAFFEGLTCGPDRNNFMFAADSTPGTLSSISAPAGDGAATICDGA